MNRWQNIYPQLSARIDVRSWLLASSTWVDPDAPLFRILHRGSSKRRSHLDIKKPYGGTARMASGSRLRLHRMMLSTTMPAPCLFLLTYFVRWHLSAERFGSPAQKRCATCPKAQFFSRHYSKPRTAAAAPVPGLSRRAAALLHEALI